MAVWATYVKCDEVTPWQLAAFSVLGADRARALAEQEHARQRVVGAQYRTERFESVQHVRDRLD